MWIHTAFPYSICGLISALYNCKNISLSRSTFQASCVRKKGNKMHKLSAQIFHTMLLLCCVGVVSTAECDTAKQQQEQCFSVLGISYLDMDNLDKDNKEVCRSQQLYAAAIRCALTVSKRCPSVTELWSEKFLDDEQIVQAISLFCSRIQDGGLMTLIPLNPVKILPSLSRARRDVCTNGLEQAIANCYTKEGMRFQALNASDALFLALYSFWTEENLRALCSADVIARQRATTCAFGLGQNCIHEDYKDYVHNLSQIIRSMEYMCSHYEEINFSCMNKIEKEFEDCGHERLQDIQSSEDVKYVACRIYPVVVQCQNEVLPSCGCNTTRLYDRVVRDYLNPTACSPITEPYPVCVPGTGNLPGRGTVTTVSWRGAVSHAVSPLSASVVTLLMAALMAVIFSV